MNHTRYLTEIIEEVDQLACSHPASVNIDVAHYYYSLTKMIRPLLIVEIGCFIGFSTLHFAQALKELGFGKILSIDAFDWEVNAGQGLQNRQVVAEYYRQKANLTDVITYVKGYSTVVYPQIAHHIKNKIDLLYIDGDHSIVGTFADFNTYYNDVRIGGHLILHDIYPSMCGVEGPRVLLDHLKAYRTIPNHLELIEIQTRDGFGIAVLRKLSAQSLHIHLPEPRRIKRILQKLQGQLPWFTKIQSTFVHQRFSIVLTIVSACNHQPIAEATLTVPQRWNEQRVSDSNGKIYLDHYLPNRYLLTLSAPGYIVKRDVLINVIVSATIQEFTIALETFPKVSIVIVEQQDGRLMSGANLHCLQYHRTYQTTENGEIYLEDCLPGDYPCLISATGYLEQTVTIPITNEPLQTFTFGLTRLPNITVVITTQNDRPIPQVLVICPQLAFEKITDIHGKIVVERCLPEQYCFTVTATGYFPKKDFVVVVSAEPIEQIFTVVLEAKPTIPAEWPLFARIQRFAQIKNPKIIHQRIFSAKSSHVRMISLENFTEEQLIAEIAALPENGGEIYLPPGRIELTTELKLRSGIRLVGIADTTEFVFKNSRFGIILQGTNTEIISHVCLENLRIRHEGTHQFCAAIFVTHAQEITLTHIEIIAPRAVGFLLSDQVYRTLLEHCTVREAGLVGFMLIRDVCDTLLTSCLAERCQQSGVFLTDMKLPPGVAPLDFDTQIHHTTENIGNFGVFSPEDPCTYRNTLQNCIFRNNRKMGITTDGVGYLRVINCVIADNDCEGITLDNGSWGCQVQNCHIYNNGWRGLQQEVELNLDFVSDKGYMADGSSTAKLPGISLDNAAYCRIENNCIEGNWGDGVKLVRAVYACTIAHNLIANNNQGENDEFHFFGVLVGVATRQHPEQNDFPSCHNNITDNDILGTHYAGIHLLAGTVDNQLQNNRIIGATFMAIEDHTVNN